MEELNEKQETISILDIIIIFVKNIKLIFLLSFISGVIMVVLAILSIVLPADSLLNFFPNKFKPEVTVLLKTPGSSQSGISSLLNNSEIGSLVGMFGGNTGIGSSDLGELVKVLMHTNEIRDSIIKKYNFKEKYHIIKYIDTQCRKIFDENVSLQTDYVSNTVKIGYIDTDAVFATEVVNQLVTELEKKVKSLYLKTTQDQITFLQTSLATKEAEFKQLQDQLITYQKKYGIVDINKQAENSLTFIAELQADIITNERKLKGLEKHSPHDTTEIEILKYDINLSRNLVNELIKGGNTYSDEFLPLDTLPEIAANLLNIKQDLTIQGVILEMLKQQYEAVKIEESDKSETFNVLEWAEVPEMKDSPRRSVIIIAVVFVTFIFAILISFIKEYLLNIKKVPDESKKLDIIKYFLKIKKAKQAEKR